MTRLVIKNGHKKEACYKEIGLFSENIDPILSPTVNTIRRAYVIC